MFEMPPVIYSQNCSMLSWCRESSSLAESNPSLKPCFPHKKLDQKRLPPELLLLKSDHIEVPWQSNPTSVRIAIHAQEIRQQRKANSKNNHSFRIALDVGVQTDMDLMPSVTNTRATRSKSSIHHPIEFPQLHKIQRMHKKVEGQNEKQGGFIPFNSSEHISQSIRNKFPPSQEFHPIESYHYCVAPFWQQQPIPLSIGTIQQKDSNCSQVSRKPSQFILTPRRRKFLMDRDTIISKSNEDASFSEHSMRIEESVILQPQIKSQFCPITPPSFGPRGEQLQLALELRLNFLVCLKEVPIQSLEDIRHQLLIYKQMAAANCGSSGILPLYQTYIHSASYIFVKQPYIQSLREELSRASKGGSALVNIYLREIEETIESMQKVGLRLRGSLCLQDIVVGVRGCQIERVGVFWAGLIDKVKVSEVLDRLRQQMNSCLKKTYS